MVRSIVRILQACEEIVDSPESPQPARTGFPHRGDGPGIRNQGFEGQGFLLRDPDQQHAKCVGHGEPDPVEHRGGFITGPLVDTGANDGIGGDYSSS